MSFLVALQFLTAIPVRLEGELSPRVLGRAMAWFPVVGLMMGAVLALSDWALNAVLPPAVSAALLLSLWLALTGGLHLDGLMDCCDGLLGARPPEKRLEIMKDTHVGAFAVAGAICVLLVKFAALLETPPAARMAGLLVVPAVTRAVMVFAARAYPYARPGQGLGHLFRQGLTWVQVGVAAVVAISAAGLVLGLRGVALVVAIWLETVVIAWLVQRRIPGLTGDVYGMINEVTEASALLLLLV